MNNKIYYKIYWFLIDNGFTLDEIAIFINESNEINKIINREIEKL